MTASSPTSRFSKLTSSCEQAQSRMMQQARMASLGQTAAGVAHEINNPLSFVTNNLSVAQARGDRSARPVCCSTSKPSRLWLSTSATCMAKISDLADEVDLPYVLENLDGLMERSQRGLLRIQKIVADLRDFARLEEAEFKEADLNAGISTTVRLMQTVAVLHVRLRSRRTWTDPDRRTASRPRSTWWCRA